MEPDKVYAAVRNKEPASTLWPRCNGGGHAVAERRAISSRSKRVPAGEDHCAGVFYTYYYRMTPVDGLNRDDLVNEGQVIGHLDNSGCGTRALHVERKARDVSVNISFHCAYERSYYGEVMDDAPHDISGIK